MGATRLKIDPELAPPVRSSQASLESEAALVPVVGRGLRSVTGGDKMICPEGTCTQSHRVGYLWASLPDMCPSLRKPGEAELS